ncbi:MAG TPA: helix-turn-helix transcriptional regulator [Mycobacteriales bacterium]|nr:helix-turn-helix transcriptional regulator [Mycobacteriales bacterium]
MTGERARRPDPALWEEPDMRALLAVQDITQVYRLLQTLGYSQQRIAALTGQSQPEVSAIVHGRKVMAYDVIERVIDGLGVPRGYAGLAYVPDPPWPRDRTGIRGAAPDQP